eukprot:1160828-Pelagomonas_calceolata.AAC.7
MMRKGFETSGEGKSCGTRSADDAHKRGTAEVAHRRGRGCGLRVSEAVHRIMKKCTSPATRPRQIKA